MTLPDGFAFRVEFDPAWDKRAEDPNKGQHYAQFRFALIGPLGAVEWMLFTGWTVESAEQGPLMTEAHHPLPAAVGVHIRVPDGTPGAHECHLVGQCMDGGFSFLSDRFYKALVLGGYDELALRLLERYMADVAEAVQSRPL